MSHFSITADRFIKKARITSAIRSHADAIGVTIHRAKVGDFSKRGIHKLECEQFELEDALEVAERDGFTAIYLHTFKTWRAEKPRKPFPPLRLVVSK